jgi:heme/copper-type cytochrome/quinol oxidase subunit 2
MRARRAPVQFILVAGLVVTVAALSVVTQSKREVAVTGKKYTYVSSDSGTSEIRVRQGELVTITFSVDDIAHTFTVADDHYRLDRRADKGKPVTFRFLADKAGEFEIRCTLTTDPRCAKEMRGKLVVQPPADQPRR